MSIGTVLVDQPVEAPVGFQALVQQRYRERLALGKGLRPGISGKHPFLYRDEELVFVQELVNWPSFMSYPTREQIPELVCYCFLLFLTFSRH
jgi:hypothetical protein